MRRRTAASLALLAATACGAQPGPSAQTPGPAIGPASASPSPGTQRVVCAVRSDHGRVRLALDLPKAFTERRPCTWVASVPYRERHHPMNGYDVRVVLSLSTASSKRSVATEYDAEKDDASEEFEGDDSILDFTLRRDVPVFGSTRGDRLSYLCACDGQGRLSRFAQADGVFLEWGSDAVVKRRTDAWLEAALRSAGTVS